MRDLDAQPKVPATSWRDRARNSGLTAASLSHLRQMSREWGYMLARPILLSVILALVAGTVVSILEYRADQAKQQAELDKITTHAQVMAQQVEAFDYAAVEASMSLLLAEPFVSSVVFVDQWDYRIALTEQGATDLAQAVMVRRQIVGSTDGHKLGELTVGTRARSAWAVALQGLGGALIAFFVFLALSLALILGFTLTHVVRPLRDLGDAMNATMRTGRPYQSPKLDNSSHIGRFALAFNQMQARLTASQTELMNKNAALKALSLLNAQHVSVVENVMRNTGSFVRHFGPGGAISDYGARGLAGVDWDFLRRFHEDPNHLVDCLERSPVHALSGAKVEIPTGLTFAEASYQVDIILPNRREVSISALRLGPSESVYICTDVTDQKRIERDLIQANKMEALGVMASGLSHDFNNLLQIVTSTLELSLEQDEMSPQLRNRLRGALAAGWRGADVIRSMLAYSRTRDSGLEPCEVSRLARNVATIMHSSLPPTINLSISIEPNLHAIANAALLDTAIMNLIHNASDALNGRGDIWLRVYATGDGSDHDPRMVVVTVEDNGPGVPPEARAHIFEPFFTTKGQHGGTGLGLSLAACMAQNAGGDCSYADRPGGGARFVLRLPATNPAPLRPAVMPDLTETADDREIHVLLVDDETAALRLMTSSLEKEGFKVYPAQSLTQAREILQGPAGRLLNVVMTDVGLPDGSGLDLCEELHDRLPILLISGKGLDSAAEQVEFDAFLHKPFRLSVIGPKLRQIIDERAEASPTDA